ncbi:hypothetical protein [Erwinia amylovora]|uniref:hypothetical protein n=1 Tax=Erwinia amylovora TaxID=552 RepID=UPI003D03969F
MTDLETAARALIADWDNRMSGEREQLKEYDGHEYWSPSAAAVSSERIAALRAALSPERSQPVEIPFGFVCDGCRTFKPNYDAYLAEIRSKGKISCCPETKPIAVYARASVPRTVVRNER